MAQKFKQGDLVELKSGGPTMVIDQDWGDGSYRCTWFAGSKHNYAEFQAQTLKKADDDQ